MALIPIILSGGAGTRLWPLSRESAPKPFMVLPGDSASLLAKTFARATALPGIAGLVTIAHRDHYFDARDAYAGVSPGQALRIAYLLEPFGRNTAAAVALGAFWAEATAGASATLLVLPADHLIRDQAAFAAAVERAAALAREGWLVTFGIPPTRPETGYGYLELGDALALPDAFRVRRFTEKPPRAEASRYLASNGYLWNSGMFCFSAATALSAFAQHSPALLAAVRSVWDPLSKDAGSAMLEIDAALFESVPESSFDVAVMEKAQNVAVVRGRFDWSDVGSWQAVLELTTPDGQGNREGNRGQGECITIATRDTYVYAGDRVVATVGVEGLVIVDTPDAVLVAHRAELQRVKEVVAELKARGHDAYRLHRTVKRPWGAFTVLEERPGFKIKRIEVKPGAALSLQLHQQRSEHWIVVGGEARVTNGDRVFVLRANESTVIPAQTRHRLENPGTEPLIMIEVQCGGYLGEDDIVRLEDQYGRVKT
jgi:mannose-1-phosphate guanylyltransferase